MTRIMVTGESLPGENRLVVEKAEADEKAECRVWSSFRSKLEAGIVGGIGSCPVMPGAKVLYSEGASGTTALHLSDMIGLEGVVRSSRLWINMAKKRPNVLPIVEDTRQPQRCRIMVDGIFSDLARPD